MLKLSCTNEPTTKVELRHVLTSGSFDLDASSKILIDLYIPPSLNPATIGLRDPIFGWHPIVNTIILDQWFTAEFNVSNTYDTGLNTIAALVFENLATTSGSLYVDNIRLQDSPSSACIGQGRTPTKATPKDGIKMTGGLIGIILVGLAFIYVAGAAVIWISYLLQKGDKVWKNDNYPVEAENQQII